jgi:hypothetical protein
MSQLESRQPIENGELSLAIEQLRDFFSCGELDELQPSHPNAVYTSALTFWLMIRQRLGSGQSLKGTVKNLVDEMPQFVPDNKRIRDGLLSANTSSYSDARHRLKLPVVRYALKKFSQLIIEQTSHVHGQRWFLLDGTTMTLPPTSELKAAFPPATNQHGESVWPVMMIFAAHEMQSGCAVEPEIGPMYGSKNVSELKMARQVVKQLAPGSVVMADAGLGIFAVAYGAVEAKHDFVFRLSKQRFDSLVKKAETIEHGKTWSLLWKPTAKERKTTASLPGDAQLRVRLHRYTTEEGEEIYLVTSLRDLSCEQLAAQYRRRYDIETDIRDVKVTMNTERIRATSKEMVLKELYTSLFAYNMVVQFRRQAAEVAKLPPRRMSFKGIWDTFDTFLRRQLLVLTPQECQAKFQRALKVASKDIIPHRPGRNFKRAAHPRRQKTTKWQKQQRQEAKIQSKTKNENQNLETISSDTS